MSSDPNAIIINSDYPKRELERISQARTPLLLGKTIEEDFNINSKKFISEEEIPLILQRVKTRILQSENPQALVDEQLVKHIAGFLRSNHIVGLRIRVYSAAYTDYAVTRGSRGWFRNYPSFNDSFKNNSLDRRGGALLT